MSIPVATTDQSPLSFESVLMAKLGPIATTVATQIATETATAATQTITETQAKVADLEAKLEAQAVQHAADIEAAVAKAGATTLEKAASDVWTPRMIVGAMLLAALLVLGSALLGNHWAQAHVDRAWEVIAGAVLLACRLDGIALPKAK